MNIQDLYKDNPKLALQTEWILQNEWQLKFEYNNKRGAKIASSFIYFCDYEYNNNRKSYGNLMCLN